MKKISLFLFSIILFQLTFAQTTVKKGFDPSRLELGGNFGLMFGQSTNINIAPEVGYKLNKYSSAGVSLGYNYYSYRYDDLNKDIYSSLSLGGYLRLYPSQYIVLTARPVISNVWATTITDGDKVSVSRIVPSFLVGGGVRMYGTQFMLLYDVVQNAYSPYGTGLIYSIGFSF